MDFEIGNHFLHYLALFFFKTSCEGWCCQVFLQHEKHSLLIQIILKELSYHAILLNTSRLGATEIKAWFSSRKEKLYHSSIVISVAWFLWLSVVTTCIVSLALKWDFAFQSMFDEGRWRWLGQGTIGLTTDQTPVGVKMPTMFIYFVIFWYILCLKLYEALLNHQGWCAWFHFCRPTWHVVLFNFGVSHGQEREGFMNFIHQEWERRLDSHQPVTQWQWSHENPPGSIQTMSSCWRASSFLPASFLGHNPNFEAQWYILQSGLPCWNTACNTMI